MEDRVSTVVNLTLYIEPEIDKRIRYTKVAPISLVITLMSELPSPRHTSILLKTLLKLPMHCGIQHVQPERQSRDVVRRIV